MFHFNSGIEIYNAVLSLILSRLEHGYYVTDINNFVYLLDITTIFAFKLQVDKLTAFILFLNMACALFKISKTHQKLYLFPYVESLKL